MVPMPSTMVPSRAKLRLKAVFGEQAREVGDIENHDSGYRKVGRLSANAVSGLAQDALGPSISPTVV